MLARADSTTATRCRLTAPSLRSAMVHIRNYPPSANLDDWIRRQWRQPEKGMGVEWDLWNHLRPFYLSRRWKSRRRGEDRDPAQERGDRTRSLRRPERWPRSIRPPWSMRSVRIRGENADTVLLRFFPSHLFFRPPASSLITLSNMPIVLQSLS